jgi:hypothetical protein
MSGKKELILLNEKGARIHNRYCYKILKSAVRRAIDINMNNRYDITIWDNASGQDIAMVVSRKRSLCVVPTRPRLFNARWS